MRCRTAKRLFPYLLACTCVVATPLVGCSGGTNGSDTTNPADESGSTTSSTTSEPTDEASSLAVPPDGPTTITEFSIPGGAETVDIGPPSAVVQSSRVRPVWVRW